jgi:uncharacterized protein (TIGR02145 family)
MKTHKNAFYLICILSILLFSCSDKDEIKIGEQVWMTENLNVTNFRNGDPITEAKTQAEWENSIQEGKPAWCYYDNNLENGNKYGVLYNFFAITDQRGLAPSGWRIPDDVDWTELYKYVGNSINLKSTEFWAQDGNGTNNSSFNGRPNGYRTAGGARFDEQGLIATWWSSSSSLENKSVSWSIKYYDSGFSNSFGDYGWGYGVRCIKEK